MDNVLSEEPAVQNHLHGKPKKEKITSVNTGTRNVRDSSFC
jgi:hypothetical protein